MATDQNALDRLIGASYPNRLEAAYEEAKKTGRKVTLVFNRAKFMEEFPEFSKDVRMAFTPGDFVVNLSPYETVTVGELRRLCLEKGPGCKKAVDLALATQGHGDNHIVTVLKQDLNTLLEGKVKGGPVVDHKGKPAKPASPKSKKKFSEPPPETNVDSGKVKIEPQPEAPYQD